MSPILMVDAVATHATGAYGSYRGCMLLPPALKDAHNKTFSDIRGRSGA